MRWKKRPPTVKRLDGEYPDGVRVPAKEMKASEARLERSTSLPKYDITIKPRATSDRAGGKVIGLFGLSSGYNRAACMPTSRLGTRENQAFSESGAG